MFDERTPPQSVAIPGYPYYITIDGEVFRNGAKEPLKPVLRRDGYTVTLCFHNKRKKEGRTFQTTTHTGGRMNK